MKRIDICEYFISLCNLGTRLTLCSFLPRFLSVQSIQSGNIQERTTRSKKTSILVRTRDYILIKIKTIVKRYSHMPESNNETLNKL